MKILVFGGTFNPPHLGHQLMIEQVLSRPVNGITFDQLWLLPVGRHSFAKSFVNNDHRLVMIQLMMKSLFEKNPSLESKVLIEKYEIERDEESQTFSTLEALSENYKEHEFSFLIGSDNLVNFHLWHNYQLMLKKYPFYVYPRTSFSFSMIYEGMYALSNFPQMEVSSTKVREAFMNNTSLNDLLDDKVINYIKENKLYVAD